MRAAKEAPRSCHQCAMDLRAAAALSLSLLFACGTTPDERPATFEVISLAVLAPSCGQVQCHSSSTNLEGYAFDTLEGSRQALRKLVGVGGRPNSELMEVLTADGDERMPADTPMDEKDIALIQEWIDDGAPGL